MRPSPLLLHAVLPTLAVGAAGGRVMGPVSVDVVWSYWRMWSTSRGQPFHTTLVNHPEGIDLLASAGGWADILLGGLFATVVDPLVAHNLVIGVCLLLAGLGGHALARTPRRVRAGCGARRLALPGRRLRARPRDGRAAGARPRGRQCAGAGRSAALLAQARLGWGHRVWGSRGAGDLGPVGELAILLAGIAAFLAPFLWWSGRTKGSVARWAVAAAVCAVLAAPIVVLFLGIQHGVREHRRRELRRPHGHREQRRRVGLARPPGWCARPG